jgi:hypothetical protein
LPSNFDSQAFETALEKLGGLCRSLFVLSGYKQNAGLAFSFSMRKALPSKDFHTLLQQMQEREGASHHSRIRIQDILKNEVPDAIIALKSAFMTASGGLKDFFWEDAEIVFSMTQDDHSVNLCFTRLKKANSTKFKIPLKKPKQDPNLDILANHADLDLEGEVQKFGIEFISVNERGPFEVLAPSPEAAVAHFCTLTQKRPSNIKTVTQILDTIDVRNAAQEMMARRQPNASL